MALQNLIIVILGIAIAVATHYPVSYFYERLRQHLQLGPKLVSGRRTPPFLTGICERIFFCLAIAAGAPDWLTGMIGWLAVKLGANWQVRSELAPPERTNYAFSALLTGLVSMFFAGVAGYFIRYLLWRGP
jgi:hypothetical protein